jgi:TonB-linked SusC/RagA family outer membrane protein
MKKIGPRGKITSFVMKVALLQFFLILSFTVIGLANESTGQGILDKKISVVIKEENFKSALRKLSQEAGIRFSYTRNTIPEKEKVSVSAQNETLANIFNALFKPYNIRFEAVGSQVILKKTASGSFQGSVMKVDLDFNFAFPFRPIRGTVKDAQGKPVADASITIKGTRRGTSTDVNGEFSIDVQDTASVLVISAVGYQTTEVTVQQESSLSIVLVEAVNKLDEVVVVGYGTQKAINLTGAVGTVSSKVLESRPLVNLGQGLQGTIPGLNVNLGNGAPGQGASFNLRGTTSINGGAPLVLVDGVVMDPNLISPDDVADITVLKDAASAAIYGGRAAFGVILITTKKAKANAGIKISYSGNYTLSRPTKMPDYQNGPEYINTFRAAMRNSAGGTYQFYTEQDSILAEKYYNDPANNSTVYVDPNNPNLYRYVGNTNWIEELYPGSEPMMNHNLSVSGGEGKTTYLASVGYYNQKGLLKAADQEFNRYNATLKLNTKATQWLELNFKTTLNHTDLNTPNGTRFNDGTSQTFAFIPTDLKPIMPIHHPDGNFSGQGSFTNMFALMALNGRQKYSINDLWLTGGVVLKPVKNVRIVGDYTWNTYNYNKTQHYKAFSEYGANGVLLGTYPWTTPSRLYQTNSNDSYYALNGYIDYENTFAGKHYLKVMAGYNQELKQNRSFNVTGKNLVDPTLPSLVPNSDPNPVIGAAQSEWAVSGSFFRLNYIFDEKYLLEVNGRYDGSSRFPRGNRYIFAPSISGGWRVSEEKFFEPLLKYVSQLKVRASYGTLGNQFTTTTYPYIANMPVGQTGYVFDNNLTSSYVGAPGLVNPDFTWEKVTTFNIGVDASLLNNRLDISFDRYTRTTKDMIVGSAPLPAILGTNPPLRNAADLETTGWELNIAWKDRVTKDFSYNISFNLSDYKSTITKYDLNPTGIIGYDVYYVGKRLGEVWGYTTAGYFQSQEEVQKSPTQTVLGYSRWVPGDIKYYDLNGDGRISNGNNTVVNPGDLRVLGNNLPRYIWGFNISASYKNFDATLFFQGVMKRDYWLGGSYFWAFSDDEWGVPMKYHLNSWTPQNKNAYYPLTQFGAWWNQQTQTKYKQNAAYTRLKQVTIGYSLPAGLLNRVHIDRLRLYVTGQNLFEITKLHDAFDPELLDATAYPLSRSFTFGLQLGL